MVAIPAIIKVADLKHLMDEPDSDRKFHSNRTPTLGGIAIFAGTVFSFSFFSDYLYASSEIRFMTSGLILLFFAGIKDDILLLTPLKKLAVQMVSAILVTVLGKLYLTSLWGMFEISEISATMGIFLTFLIIVALINAFNLIDGIDGLAGGLGLISCLFLGSWFYLTGAQSLSILSFSLAGALLGFLRFNFKQAKIFMGDTGSMLIGFIIAILTIKFIENNRSPGMEASPYYIKAAPGVAVAVILIPLIDMTRVFFQRLLKGRNPLSADRIHIHHLMLDVGFKPLQVTVLLYLVSLGFIGLSLLLRQMRSLQVVFIVSSIALVLTFVLVVMKRRRIKNRN